MLFTDEMFTDIEITQLKTIKKGPGNWTKYENCIKSLDASLQSY